nr:hypothetical protein [Tanacetum cinerariifolium]
IHGCFRDELDNVVEEEEEGWIFFLGGNNSSETKKYQGSNSGDGGNTRDGVKIVGRVIGSCGGIDVGDDLNGGVGSTIYRVKEAFVPMFSSWLRLRAREW